jgi:hypothetical protein
VSFGACGFARSTVLNQSLFYMNRSLYQKPAAEIPVADARLAGMLGDTGQPEAIKLNTEELTHAVSCAYILLHRHCNKNDPETGRRPEFLRKWLREPKDYITAQANAFEKMVLERRTATEKATALSLGADPSARLAVIAAEVKALNKADSAPAQNWFIEGVSVFKDREDQELIDVIVEAMTNAGMDVSKEIEKAAKMYLESQKTRYEAGGYVTIDQGIYALAQK